MGPFGCFSPHPQEARSSWFCRCTTLPRRGLAPGHSSDYGPIIRPIHLRRQAVSLAMVNPSFARFGILVIREPLWPQLAEYSGLLQIEVGVIITRSELQRLALLRGCMLQQRAQEDSRDFYGGR